MALPDFAIRERLSELWRQIDNVHFSYLETDDSPEKLDQRKKLEAYIMDYLCLVPHESKFFLQETGDILSRSIMTNTNFTGYRLARGWAAIARYAGNLLSQPWRKEYSTIRLYSGFYKHEVEGSGLCDGRAMLYAMGYKACVGDSISTNTLILDGPVCPDRVAAVSRDSLIAYVECQLMTHIWEEVSMRGGSSTWLEILHCRERYAGDVEHAVAMLLNIPKINDDLYCNVKFSNNSQPNIKEKFPYQSLQNNTNISQVNGHIMAVKDHTPQNQSSIPGLNNAIYLNDHEVNSVIKSNNNLQNNYIMMNNQREDHSIYFNSNFNQYSNSVNNMNGIHPNYDMSKIYDPNMSHINNFGNQQYFCNPMVPQQFVMPTITYPPLNHSSTLSLANGYHCSTAIHSPPHCSNTSHLIDLNSSNCVSSNKHCCHLNSQMQSKQNNYHINNKIDPYNCKDLHMKNYCTTNSATSKRVCDLESENYENSRRNSAPRTTLVNTAERNFMSIPRSDTQPSLSKAKEDGMGTFESWDYVFRNLENQGYSKDLGDMTTPSSPLERESKTLNRISNKDPRKYQQTTMDLEDALRAINLEKNSDEELFRTAKINETLLKIKQENEAKAVRANLKKQALVEGKDRRKLSTENSTNEGNFPIKVTDKTRLISKEDSKSKKEIDKEVFNNNSSNGWSVDGHKNKKSIVKCLSSDIEKNLKKKSLDQTSNSSKKSVSSQGVMSNTQSSQSQKSTYGTDTVDQSLKTRLVVTLHDSDAKIQSNEKCETEQKSKKQSSNNKWECGTCTYLNTPMKKACEMCGKSRQAGVESLPLTSGGKECPACTLVNQRQATVCEACDTSLKHSPTYI